jgi:hypothetical protein
MANVGCLSAQLNNHQTFVLGQTPSFTCFASIARRGNDPTDRMTSPGGIKEFFFCLSSGAVPPPERRWNQFFSGAAGSATVTATGGRSLEREIQRTC